MLTLNARTFFRTNRHDIQERDASFILIAKWSIRICYILGRPKHYHFRWMVVRNLSLALEAMHRVRALCLAAAGGHGAGRLMLAHWQVAEAGEEVSNDNGYSRFRSHLFDLEFNVYKLNINLSLIVRTSIWMLLECRGRDTANFVSPSSTLAARCA